jgi:hypothetical protein
MSEYQPDFPQIRWLDQAGYIEVIHDALRLLIAGRSLPELSLANNQVLDISMVHCKAAFGPSGPLLLP